MKSKKYPKYFVAIGCFVAAIVVCLLVVFYRDFNGKNLVLDNLYGGLKIPQQTEQNSSWNLRNTDQQEEIIC